ncbi:MAG: hypothetical protein LC742_02135, partial [Acidobacteria bacterium]|nr:hypothetical protein [Acidobacteriota bacterium]
MNIYTTRSSGQRRKVVSMLCAAALFVANLGNLHAQTATTAAQVDRTRLEIIEDLSEALANDLLELSIATRDRNLEQTGEFWPAKLSANAFPAKPLPIKPVVKWIGARQWTVDAPPHIADAQKVSLTSGATNTAAMLPTVSREDFMRDWTKFLAHFSEIEDARFKVKDATFEESAQSIAGAKVPTAAPGARGKARIA